VAETGGAEVRWFKASVVSGGSRIDPEVETLIVQMARENFGWGYHRIAGALVNLGHEVSDQTDFIATRIANWQAWISSPLRCSQGADPRRTMSCS
jgi:hypothetical protein